jgi:hypothetical protein
LSAIRASTRLTAHRQIGRATLALLTIEAQALDALTFCLAVHAVGIRGESNLLMAGLFHAGGVPAVLAAKAVGAGLAAALVLRVPGRWALLPAAAGLVGAITNLLA